MAKMTSVLFFIALLILGFSKVEAAETLTIYVSPEGKDTWTGRLAKPKVDGADGPLASLAGARDAVRALRSRTSGLAQPVRILFADGTYPMSNTVVFTPVDSGSEEFPITYEAAPGAKAVVTGGRRIEGWAPGEGKLRSVKIADPKWRFRQLFVNGERYVRARAPNKEDYWHLAEKFIGLENGIGSLQVKKGDARSWPRANEIEIVLHRFWDISRFHLTSIDSEKSLITFRTPKDLKKITHWTSGNAYWLENSLAFCDSPGEWFLDTEKGILYLRPLEKHMNGELKVVAPVLESLIKFVGRQDKPIRYITFRGLSFQHADWSLADEGYDGHQADIEVGAHIEGDYVESMTFEKCDFSHLGRYALWFRRDCKANVVSACEFSDLGAGAVEIGEGGDAQKSINFETSHNKVVGCHIFDNGHVYPSAVGIWVGFASYSLIADNHIHDTSYSGISVGWGWADIPNGGHHNIVERNYLHDIQNIMGDGGAIYTLGRQPGTMIRDNVIHDVEGYYTYGSGIYLYNGSAEITLENNLVARTIGPSFVNNAGGGRNVLRNNIFALSATVVYSINKNSQKSIEENIVYIKEGFFSGDGWDYKATNMRNNLYYFTEGSFEFPGGRPFEEWQKIGLDAGSIVADPGFVDVANGDFNLKPDSPALKVGFKPFKVPIVGLARPDRRKDPRLVKVFALEKSAGVTKTITPQVVEHYTEDGRPLTRLYKNAAVAEPDPQVERGLVAWWPCDQILSRGPGSPLNGKIYDRAQVVNGRVGKAVLLDGEKGHIEVAPGGLLNLTDALSLSVWVRLDAQQTSHNGNFGIVEWSQNCRLMVPEKSPPYSITFDAIRQNAQSTGVMVEKAVPANVWTHIVATMNNSTGEWAIYLNGKLAGKKTFSERGRLSDMKGTDFVVGRRDSHAFLKGALDELKVYSRALSAEEVKAAYEKSAAPPLR